MDVGIQSPNFPLLNKRKNSTSGSSNKSSKLDVLLDADSAKLPPNTGPPGTVQVTSNGSNSNKNLRHVPCKFHRQGNCQAGSSCPFSHNVDGSLSADKLPSHFLPDGTRVNSRNYTHKRSNNYHNNSEQNYNFKLTRGTGNSLPSDSANVTPLSDKQVSSYNPSLRLKSRSSSFNNSLAIDITQNSFANYPNYVSSSASYSQANSFGIGSSGNQLTSANGIQVTNNGTDSLTGISKSVMTPTRNSSLNIFKNNSSSTSPVGLTQPSSASPQQSNFFFRNQPISHSPTNNLSMQISRSFNSKLPASHGSYSSYLNTLNDSAIIDDDNDYSDDEIFEEDYIPASLGNEILTPQEVQRRDSRSQSGTLSVRPTFRRDTSKMEIEPEIDNDDGSLITHDDVFLME